MPKPNQHILILFILLIVTINVSAQVLSSNENHNCAIQADNTIVCWGSNKWGQAIPPPSTFSQVSAGLNHTCGIRTDKTVTCWGLKGVSQSPPMGTFSQISAGGKQSCGIKTDSSIVCWGSVNETPTGTFSQVSVSSNYVCAIQSDNTVKCWTHEDNLGPGKGKDIPPKGTFSQVATGIRHSCGIQLDNSAVCWGFNGDARGSPPPETTYEQISIHNYFSCALKTDKTVVCFGPQDLSPSEGIRPPNSTCGSCPYPSEDGNVCACSTSLDNTFSQVEVGRSHACGIQTNNRVSCWGYDREGQAMPPLGLMVRSSKSNDCLVYGVHDDNNNTQLFIINISPNASLNVHARSRLEKSYHLEALDVSPLTNRIYAASQEGLLYEVRNGAQLLTEVGEIGFEQVRALSFHPDGSLWGWSQGTGLFKIDMIEDDKLNAEAILAYQGQTEIADLTWNQAGTILYGVENSAQGTQLWAYFKNENSAKPICGQLMNSLTAKVGALETLPDDTLVLSFQENESLSFNIIEIPKEGQKCQSLQQGKLATEFNDIKGIGWPNCKIK